MSGVCIVLHVFLSSVSGHSLAEMALRQVLSVHVPEILRSEFPYVLDKDISDFVASSRYSSLSSKLIEAGEANAIAQSLCANGGESFEFSRRAMDIIAIEFGKGMPCLFDKVPGSFLEELVPIPFPLEFLTDNQWLFRNAYRTHAVFKLKDGFLAKYLVPDYLPRMEVVAVDFLKIGFIRPILVDLKHRCAVQTRRESVSNIVMQARIATLLDYPMGSSFQLYLEREVRTFQIGSHTLQSKLSSSLVSLKEGKLVLDTSPDQTVLAFDYPLDKWLSREEWWPRLSYYGFKKAIVLEKPDHKDILLLTPFDLNGAFRLIEKIPLN